MFAAVGSAARHAPRSSRGQVAARNALNGSSDAIIGEIVRLGEAHGVEVRGAVHGEGVVSSEILREVRAGGHNLLVIGVNPRPGADLFFGNVPAELLAHCDCSILFIISESPGSVGESRESRVAIPDRIDNATGGKPSIISKTLPNIRSEP